MSSVRGTRRAVLLASTLWAMSVARPAHADRTSTPAEAARRDANEMLFAFLRNDFETYLTYAHPALIERMHGKERFVAMMRKGFELMKSDGRYLVRASAEAPLNIVKAGDELHAALPVLEVANVPAKHGELHMFRCFVGVSRDGGKTWKFIGGAYGKDDLLKLLPNYNDKLKLPPRKAELFVPK